MNDPSRSASIDEETLLKIPPAGSELVKQAKCTSAQLDLESLLDVLVKLSTSISIACNKVTGNSELYDMIQGVKNKITALNTKSATLAQEIKETTSTDLKKLRDVYQLLFDGKEKIAIETLKLFSIDAGIVATKTELLVKGFNNTTTDIINALEDTQRTKGAREERRDLQRRGKFDDGHFEEVIDALHNSIGALKSLSAIMMNAALFWRQMQTDCESLAKKDVQNMIERAMEYPEEKRLKVWTSAGFELKVMIYCSKWAALDDACGTYMEQTKESHQKNP